MGAHTPTALHNMKHDVDPRTELLEKVKDFVDGYIPLWDNIVCAIYIRPQQTKSGLFLTDKFSDEDIYQGCVGLIISMGPDAEKMKDKDGKQTFNVGDWVRFHPEEGDRMSLGGIPCREFEASDIQGKLLVPDVIF